VPSDREVVEQIGAEHLPVEHRAAWLELLRPAVRLVPARPGEPVVARLGGSVDLSDGTPWPQWPGHGALQLVAEIDCAALTAFPLDIELPTSGRLLLFYVGDNGDPDDLVGTWDPASLAGARLLHDPAPVTPGAPDGAVELTGVSVVTAPGYEHPDLRRRFDPSGVDDAWDAHPVCSDDFHEALWERHDGPAHQVGGYADPVQGPVEAEVAVAALGNPSWSDPALAAESDRWELLVQVDSDDDAGFLWGDAGMLYWLARTDDHGRTGLDQVSFTWQCS
jgi:hypothetical protein